MYHHKSKLKQAQSLHMKTTIVLTNSVIGVNVDDGGVVTEQGRKDHPNCDRFAQKGRRMVSNCCRSVQDSRGMV